MKEKLKLKLTPRVTGVYKVYKDRYTVFPLKVLLTILKLYSEHNIRAIM